MNRKTNRKSHEEVAEQDRLINCILQMIMSVGTIAMIILLAINLIIGWVDYEPDRVRAYAPKLKVHSYIMHREFQTAEVEPVEVDIVTDTEILGEFVVTAYCSCSKCCGEWSLNRPNGIVYGSTGRELVPNYSVAVDPNVIPYGTIIYIDGQAYRADDCGGSIKGNRIDIYCGNHQQAIEWGKQSKDVIVGGE